MKSLILAAVLFSAPCFAKQAPPHHDWKTAYLCGEAHIATTWVKDPECDQINRDLGK